MMWCPHGGPRGWWGTADLNHTLWMVKCTNDWKWNGIMRRYIFLCIHNLREKLDFDYFDCIICITILEDWSTCKIVSCTQKYIWEEMFTWLSTLPTVLCMKLPHLQCQCIYYNIEYCKGCKKWENQKFHRFWFSEKIGTYVFDLTFLRYLRTLSSDGEKLLHNFSSWMLIPE